ncbi:glutathionylspermidine synthase family protein, partial [Algoriella sp.]|uniref:glutathionylspermidine synthase family protein n=1 Tax=Algoriella sp. TaxID=1872434 RepID=UPI002FC96D39
ENHPIVKEYRSQIKLLEFNADTPTSLFECGVVQWLWMENYFGETKDQFNSVHDKLIETWKMLKPYLKGQTLHFSCVRESLEDLTNIEYIRDCAIQAGINTKLIYVDEIGWNNVNFVDLEEEPITDIFKLYPWEWMMNELFAYNIKNDEINANWIEPAWKMILANKAILAILWELYPNHPLLLETYLDSPKEMKNYVKKPLLSREGANVEVVKNGEISEKTSGEYGEEGFVYQALADLHHEKSGYSIIGSWIIGQEACGITFRESDQFITTDKSRFVPHIIE